MPASITDFVAAAAAQSKKGSTVRVTNKALASAAGVAVGADVTFCQLWPVIKEGLTLLEGIVPVWAKWLIGAVIDLGNQICT